MSPPDTDFVSTRLQGGIMDTQSKPTDTVAEVLAAIENAGLATVPRRDTVSAVSRVAELLGQAPAKITVDIPDLRNKLRSVLPSAHGISRKTFGNIRGLFGSALVLAGFAEPLG